MIFMWLKTRDVNDLRLGLLIIFLSFIGGYVASDLPKEFLSMFATPLGEFFIFFCINLLDLLNPTSPESEQKKLLDSKYGDFNKYFIIVAESIISVMILQTFKYIVLRIYSK